MSTTTNSQSVSATLTGTTGNTANNTTPTTAPQIIFLNQPTPTTNTTDHHHAAQNHLHHNHHHHQLIQSDQTKSSSANSPAYQISTMQPVPNSDSHPQPPCVVTTTHSNNSTAVIAETITTSPSLSQLDQYQFQHINSNERRYDYHQLEEPRYDEIKQENQEEQEQEREHEQKQGQQELQQQQQQQQQQEQEQRQQLNSPATRFKWTKEKTQVAMNLVKYGCKPKLVSVAVGCSLRTAQKFVETVTPKIEGESFKNYEIKRRGRKSKDVNQRLNAIREVLSKDINKTQVEIAADLKVSNTTVCRDLKRIGASWKDKKNINNNNNVSAQLDGNNHQTASATTTPQQQTTRKTRQSNARNQNSNNNANDLNNASIKTRRRPRRSKTSNLNNSANDDASINKAATSVVNNNQ